MAGSPVEPMKTGARSRADSEREGAERMRAMLERGTWPSGLALTERDRRVIRHNLELIEARR